MVLLRISRKKFQEVMIVAFVAPDVREAIEQGLVS